MTLTFDTTGQLPKVARQLLEAFPDERFFAFFGKMGVGKTTLIKALCARLGVEDNVCSPTFAIINEYLTPSDETIYHFDLYRLETIADLQNIGAEDYFYSGNLCLIEWPDIAEPLLSGDTLHVTITVLPDKTRKISF